MTATSFSLMPIIALHVGVLRDLSSNGENVSLIFYLMWQFAQTPLSSSGSVRAA